MSRVLAKRVLIPHPGHAHPPLDIGVKVTLLGTDVLKLEYVVVGSVDDLLIPERVEPERRDGLWQRMCFEAFMRLEDGSSYVEYNFAPSSEWAIYQFDRYREGMVEAPLPEPDIFVERNKRRFCQTVIVDAAALLSRGWKALALSAVIETVHGAKSYWALRHPPGKPDFHHPDCFALELPAAGKA